MFIVGGNKLKTGLIGAEPSLDPKDLQDGDIKYGTDFRSVYASLLQDWLKTPSTATAAIPRAAVRYAAVDWIKSP